MKTSRIIIFFSLIAIFFGQQQINSDKKHYFVGQTIEGISKDDVQSFHYLKIFTLDKKYLFFSMKLDPIYSHLNISYQIIQLTSKRILKICQKQEVESCYIPRQSIIVNQTLILIVRSNGICQYVIDTYWSHFQRLEVNKEVNFIFTKQDQNHMFHLELDGLQFQELRIIIKPISGHFVFDRIKMFGSFGNTSQLSISSYDFQSKSLWQNAEGIIFPKRQLKNSRINLILFGSSQTVYSIICLLVNNSKDDVMVNQGGYQILHENSDIIVIYSQIFNIYPDGDFLLDIFQCKGLAKITYGESKKQLENNNYKLLELIGMPSQSHAVRIHSNSKSMVVKVQAQLARVKWIAIDQQRQVGVGYHIFKQGTFMYNSNFGEIEIVVQPISHRKKTNSTIKRVQYNLYISNSLEDLKYASLCESYLPNSIIQYNEISDQQALDSFTFVVKKTQLMKKYGSSKNLFINIVADLNILTPKGNDQLYILVYASSEIPAEIYYPVKMERYNLGSTIVVFAIFITTLLCLCLICEKIILPIIAKLKDIFVVQQDISTENNEANQQIPPSQRNPIKDSNFQTEDQLQK